MCPVLGMQGLSPVVVGARVVVDILRDVREGEEEGERREGGGRGERGVRRELKSKNSRKTSLSYY